MDPLRGEAARARAGTDQGGYEGCQVCLTPHHQVHGTGILLGQALALRKTMLWPSPANASVYF